MTYATKAERERIEEVARAARGTGGEWRRAPCPVCERLRGKVDRKRALSIHVGGGYHCFRCFLPGTLVTTRRGLIPIEDVEVGDLVLGANGWTPVVRTLSRPHDGPVLRIKAAHAVGPLVATPEHVMYRADGTKCHASELRVGDVLAQPPPLVAPFKFGVPEARRNRMGPRRRPFVPQPTTAFARVAGLYLAEGNVNPLGNPRATHFSLHRRETALADELVRYFEPHGCRVSAATERENSLRVVASGANVADALAQMFGCGCEHKHIPWEWLGDLNAAPMMVALLDALYEGDGHDTGAHARILTTTSPTLAWQVYNWLRSQGARTGLQTAKVQPGRRPAYHVRWTAPSARLCAHTHVAGSVRGVSEEHYRGLVYDLTVEDATHNYTAAGMLVSNCSLTGHLHGALPPEPPPPPLPPGVLPENQRPPDGFLPLYHPETITARQLDAARAYVEGKRRLHPAVAAAAGIGAVLTGWMGRRIVVPVPGPEGDLYSPWNGWVARAYVPLPPDAPTYLYPRGMPRGTALYRQEILSHTSDIPAIVVEGVLDALAVFPDGVAVLGKPSPAQERALAAAKRPVAVVLDGDAWQEGHALALSLRMRGQRAGSVRLPPTLDPDEVDLGDLREACLACLDTRDALRF